MNVEILNVAIMNHDYPRSDFRRSAGREATEAGTISRFHSFVLCTEAYSHFSDRPGGRCGASTFALGWLRMLPRGNRGIVCDIRIIQVRLPDGVVGQLATDARLAWLRFVQFIRGAAFATFIGRLRRIVLPRGRESAADLVGGTCQAGRQCLRLLAEVFQEV